MYLALGSGLPSFQQGSTCPVVLRSLAQVFKVPYTGLSPSLADLSLSFYYFSNSGLQVLQPQSTCSLVWAFPLSLATTKGIISFPEAT
jgi:hypothetical protein